MPLISINTSTGVERTTAGLHLRKGVRSLSVDSSDVKVLTSEIMPLLDGSRDRKSVMASVETWSRQDILKFLNALEENGFLESTPYRNHALARHDQQKLTAQSNHPRELIECINAYKKLSAKWADERTGVIRHLATEPPDPSNFKFVWTSKAALRRFPTDEERSLKTTGFGAGVSAVEATTKAVAEVLELHSARDSSDDDLLYSTAGALGQDFLDPRALCLYDRAQYADPNFPFERFSSRTRIAWTCGKWLDTRRAVWMPAFMTYFSAPPSLNQSFVQITTSGLATGTSVEDASMRAICELVERDAFMVTWLAQVPSSRLIPDALDEITRSLVDEFEARKVRLRFYLLRTGIDIPVVLSLILGDGVNWPGATVGIGAHADPTVATRRAILEQALMGPALRQAMISANRRIPRQVNQVRTALDHALYYVPKQRARAFEFLDSGKLDPILLSELAQPKRITLDFCRKRLAHAGVRVAIKDLTPPVIATEGRFFVVRALGTNLQPLHFGFGLARSASQRLQRLAKRRQLNSLPHPLA